MAYDDMQRFLVAKHSNIDKSFIDIMQKAFMEGEELDFSLVEPANIVLTSIIPFTELSPTVTPLTDLPPPKALVEPITLIVGDQAKKVAPTDPKPLT